MATANNIITPQSVKAGSAILTAAKTTYNDTTNAVLIATADATNGGVVYGITAVARGVLATTTKVMLFRVDASNNVYYIKAVLVSAYTTDAATTVPTVADFGYTETAPLRLNAGDKLYVGAYAAAANGISVDCQYENIG